MKSTAQVVMPTPPETMSTPFVLGYHMPAEWEPHEATWLAWPHKTGDWPGKAGAIPWVFAEMARELQLGERIRLLVKNAAEERLARSVMTRAGVLPKRIEYVKCDTDRSWTRDSLPSFVINKGQGRNKTALAAVKFRFDGWHRYPDHQRDDRAGIFVAEHYAERAFMPEGLIHGKRYRWILEGGSIDVDGEGTLLTTEECLLTSRRARHRMLGKEGSEALLRDNLGVTKVIWLQDGISGDDTSGHVDDFARFVRPGVVAICQEPNSRDPNHKKLKSAWERLKHTRDAKGRKLELIALPMPEPVTFGGTRLPASYANFYISNTSVLVPTFNDLQDRVALGIIADLFPTRRVVGIHARDLVLGLGTLHCSTQQEPRISKG